MEELESSGLLKEEQEQAEQQAAAAAGAAGSSTPQDGTTSQAAGTAEADNTAGAGSSDAAASGGPAEQRVLGYLRQEPSWCKVLDTASGKIYYWNLSSNEVVWQVPEGMDADALLPPDSAGAGADAAAADGEAGATPPAMDAVAPAADITAAAEAADDDQQRDSSPDELHPALAPQQAAPGRKSDTPASASSDEEEGQIKAGVAADLAKQLLQPPMQQPPIQQQLM